jgi:hypothetical protein
MLHEWVRGEASLSPYSHGDGKYIAIVTAAANPVVRVFVVSNQGEEQKPFVRLQCSFCALAR